MEVFFLPPAGGEPPFVGKCRARFLQTANIGGLGPSVLANDADHPVVAIVDGHRDESLLLKRADVGTNLPLAHSKEISEVAIGGITPVLVV